MIKKIFSRSRGFTIIELLVVIGIIAVLTGIIITNLSGSRAKARDAKRVSDLAQIQLAIEQYFDRCQQYPLAVSGGLVIDSSGGSCTSGGVTITLGTFISQIPTPLTGGTVGQTAYDYLINPNRTDYILHIPVEANTTALKDSLVDTYLTTFENTYGVSAPSWHCYNSANPAPYDYCVGPK